MKFESSLNLNKVPNHRINHECDPVSATYSPGFHECTMVSTTCPPGSPWVYYGVCYLSTWFSMSVLWCLLPVHLVLHECTMVSTTCPPGSLWVYYGVYYLSTWFSMSVLWCLLPVHLVLHECTMVSTTCPPGSRWVYYGVYYLSAWFSMSVHEGLLPVAVWLVLHEGGPVHEGLGSVPDDVAHRLLRVNSKQINLIRRT